MCFIQRFKTESHHVGSFFAIRGQVDERIAELDQVERLLSWLPTTRVKPAVPLYDLQADSGVRETDRAGVQLVIRVQVTKARQRLEEMDDGGVKMYTALLSLQSSTCSRGISERANSLQQ